MKNLTRIGHTVYKDNDNTVFICDITTANIEAILIKQIFKNTKYKILSETDSINSRDIKIITNYPFKLYENLK